MRLEPVAAVLLGLTLDGAALTLAVARLDLAAALFGSDLATEKEVLAADLGFALRGSVLAGEEDCRVADLADDFFLPADTDTDFF